MKINSIHLKNYRNHSDKKIDFTSGLNLLLGKNGAGKSSFLEAFGLAMFNSGNRQGNALTDVIKKGEKVALIIIDFTGNDDCDYILECKIVTSRIVKLKTKGENSARLSLEKINDKLLELAGIVHNSKSLFSDVISAYQNQITGIFSNSNSVRDSTFNKIFNTAIYELMSEKFCKSAFDEYKIQVTERSSKISSLKERLTDEPELSNKMSDLETQIEVFSEKINQLHKAFDTYQNDQSILVEVKNKIDRLEAEKKHTEEIILSLKKEFEKNTELLNESKSSKDLSIGLKPQYEKYVELSNLLSELTEKEKKLESFKSQFEMLKDNINSLEKNISSLENNLNASTGELNFSSQKQNELSSELDSLENNQIETTRKMSDLDEQNKIFSDYLNKFNKLKDDIAAKKEELEIKKMLQEDSSNSMADEANINSELDSYKILKAEQEKAKKERDTLTQEARLIENNIKENKTAQIELSTGICPILNDKCLNVSTGASSISDYFDERHSNYQSILDSLNDNIKKYENLDDDYSETISKLHSLEGSLSANKKTEEKIKLLQLEIELISRQLDSISLIMSNTEKELFLTIDSSKPIIENFDIFTYLKEITTEIGKELHSANKKHSENSAGIKVLNNKIDGLAKEIYVAQQRILESENKIKTEKDLLSQKQNQLNDLANSFNELDSVKLRIEEIRKELNLIKNDYEKYIEYSAKAKNLSVFEARKNEIEAGLVSRENELISIDDKFEQAKIGFSIEKVNELKELINKNKAEERVLLAEKSELDIQKGIFRRKMEENIKILIDIELLEIELFRINKKVELTEYFRKNIKEMGAKVAKRYTEEIEIKATENYRKISGKNNRLWWSSEQSYQVFLMPQNDDEGIRKFEMLSGGEQVAVALSMRAAMASTLTTARFAIFDEPTINLDQDVKHALSESINEILKDLDQAIIVTHDDVFKEMADNVIYL